MGQMVGNPMLEIENVIHRYGAVTALNNVSLSAAKGEFLTILGSSGSGKTTMLRIISGLELPTSVKTLRIGGADVARLPAAKRNCTTVFQNYALFPHMSVLENVAYGLRIRGMNRIDAAAEARRALAMVQLEAKADRGIAQMSGGERQRVALARSVVTKPAILLLDEPLGALDERLRLDMQTELMELQRSLDMTFIYITHSEEEALTMSDRVVLMSRGAIVQSGGPLDLFDRPNSRFAASFMGYENILEAKLIGREGSTGQLEFASGHRMSGLITDPSVATGAKVGVAIRAERLLGDSTGPRLGAKVLSHVYRGKYTDMSLQTDIGPLKLRSWQADGPAEIPSVGWAAKDAVIFAAE